MNEKNLHTLEFDKIREMLATYALTEGAKAQALSLLPSDYPEEARRLQRRTTDSRRLLDQKGMPSFGMVKDVADACERAGKGATLNAGELLSLANVLRTSRSLLEYIRTNKLFETSLDEIFERLIPNRTLEDKIYRSIISEDTIADDLDVKLRSARAISIINSELTPRERQIIRLRYGLDGRAAVTQREVAERLGISRSYVSRIEGGALKKICDSLARYSM